MWSTNYKTVRYTSEKMDVRLLRNMDSLALSKFIARCHTERAAAIHSGSWMLAYRIDTKCKVANAILDHRTATREEQKMYEKEIEHTEAEDEMYMLWLYGKALYEE